jgi:hypothetical protein
MVSSLRRHPAQHIPFCKAMSAFPHFTTLIPWPTAIPLTLSFAKTVAFTSLIGATPLRPGLSGGKIGRLIVDTNAVRAWT